jgi:hypothetical protein
MVASRQASHEAGAKLEAQREQNFTEQLIWSIKDIRTETILAQEASRKLGRKVDSFPCPNVDTNLAGEIETECRGTHLEADQGVGLDPRANPAQAPGAPRDQEEGLRGLGAEPDHNGSSTLTGTVARRACEVNPSLSNLSFSERAGARRAHRAPSSSCPPDSIGPVRP